MLVTIIVFIIVLNILVLVHELGHFLVALKLGIGVEEFGLGLPPRIWGIKRGKIIYSLNWLPIGGFVKLVGEDSDTVEEFNIITPKIGKKVDWDKYFYKRPLGQRAAVLLAGVTMNFLLAVVIISFIFTQGVFVPTERVHVEKIVENGPAALAGLKEKDVIISFAGEQIKKTEDLIKITKDRVEQPIDVVVKRGTEQLTFNITPRRDPPKDQGPMGVVISNLEERKYVWYQAPFYGLMEALNISYQMLASLGTLLWRLITFQPLSADIAGPIGIAQATGKAVQYGVMAVLQLMGILSLNLAIINILPIPALDGGRLLFVVLEKFIGKKVKPQAERMAHQIGMICLLALIVLVTINDVMRLFRG